MPDTTAIADLPETPAGWAQLWTAEFKAARANLEEWWKRGELIVDRFLDDRKSNQGDKRLNLFTSNTQTLESLLFGKTPAVDVERRFADSADDVARVAAEMLERLLNTDIESDSDTQQEAFRNALLDRLLSGMGNVRVRYEAGEPGEPIPGKDAILGPDGAEQAPAVEPVETRPDECVHVDYIYWKDQMWSPARTFSELRWWAFANDMSEKDFLARFGEDKKAQFTPSDERKRDNDKGEKYKDPLARCRVWECWSKDRECVDWFVEGQQETLDHKDDPLELEGFWPFPRPMFANLTTSKLLPTPDFVIAQDLYDGIDKLEARINLLEDAIRVAGVYDSTSEGVKRLLTEKGQNAMYPVANWPMFSQQGGLDGVVSWFPLKDIVEAMDKLRECRSEKIALLYQVTGMSDIMRGQASQQTTATEQAIKARFASVRVQSLQDEFARFCSEVQRIKAELVSKRFDRNTLLTNSNVQYMPQADQQLAPQAAELILSGKFDYRVSVNPDSVSLTDFAALKQERLEFATTLSGYFQGMMPMIQALGVAGAGSQAVQFTLKLGQSLAAGLKGANEMEGIFDEFIAELEQVQQQAQMNPPQPQPDPKLEAAKVKAQAEMGKAQASVQQTQLDGRVHVAKASMDMKMATQKHAMDMQKLAMQQQAAGEDHNRSMQSQEGQERLAAMKAVDKVTGGGQ